MKIFGSEAISDSLFSWVDDAGNTQTLDVDVVMSAQDKRSAKLTDHVVEDGAVITDHVVIQPDSISFELLVTQTPMTNGNGFESAQTDITAESRTLKAKSYPISVRESQFAPGGFLLLSQGVRTLVAGAANALLGAAGAAPGSSMQGHESIVIRSTTKVTTLQSATPVDRVADVHDRLIEILQNVLPVTISFKGRLYIDYVLSEVELTHAAGKFGVGTFKVQARTLNTVTGETVELPDPADFRALPKANKGNKPSVSGAQFGPPPPPTSFLYDIETGNQETMTGRGASALLGHGT